MTPSRTVSPTLPVQLFAPYRCRKAGRIRRERYQPLGNWHGRPSGKPSGGVWTSTYTPEAPTESDWVRFCRESHPDWIPAYGYLYIPPPGVKIYAINTTQDLFDLIARYGERRRNPAIFEIDFEAFARDFDGIHLTAAGLERTRHGEPHLECWDAEGTCWSKTEALEYVSRIRLQREAVPRHRREE